MQLLKKLKELNIRLPILAKVAAAAVFTLLLLTMLPAAIPETEADLPEGTLVFDNQMPDIDGVARPEEFPHLVIVYPAGDPWGREEALHVKAQLSSRFHAHFVVLADSEYLALDGATLSLYNTEPSLTLNLGISALLEESYLEALSRLGYEGLEIVRRGNRIDITSASPTRINEGVKAFANALGYDGGLLIDESLYICDERSQTKSDLVFDLTANGEFDILTFSYIDTNPYTLRAIEGMVASAKPDLVIFNGAVDGGTESRRDLAALWQNIADALAKTNTPWCFTPGTLSGTLPRVTVCEVISSFPGCIRKISGDDSSGFSITVGDGKGSVCATVYVGDGKGDLAALIASDSALYERAGETDRQMIAVLPALAPKMLNSAQGLTADKVSAELGDVYDALLTAGADTFICAASPIAPSIIEYSEGTLYICGSVGFDSQGLGGRFDYNHSLRCGLLLTIGTGDNAIRCIYAADLGLNER